MPQNATSFIRTVNGGHVLRQKWYAEDAFACREQISPDLDIPPGCFEEYLREEMGLQGTQRKMAVVATGELVEGHERLPAYTAPWFSGGASDPLPPRDDPQRRTFNLGMVALG
ncbi:hypothetical protein ACFPOI_00865 [Nonomuraea angiospora]|uniref:Uncharacterized protein n=1 Tax=Nonomuraea angiospora TaxID=46172 RepID=A0ABR9M237_9ACTN|nr:hypothetical protein [Nonomuraea angiospora]MBE1586955.1 hypothetical protein [Nonomuraea angiospora]